MQDKEVQKRAFKFLPPSCTSRGSGQFFTSCSDGLLWQTWSGIFRLFYPHVLSISQGAGCSWGSICLVALHVFANQV